MRVTFAWQLDNMDRLINKMKNIIKNYLFMYLMATHRGFTQVSPDPEWQYKYFYDILHIMVSCNMFIYL